MAVFIELVTKPFGSSFSDKVKNSGAGLPRVRRPSRGLEIKEDTYAYLRLIRSDGVEVPVLDSSSPTGQSTGYSNFILQAVQDARMERHQIVETFGETYLYLFGESPHMLNVSAVVINSFDFNWKAEFIENYKRYFRGTRCVELGARCYLMYDDNVVEGYILNAQTQDTADNNRLIPLSFQFFVTNEQNVSLIGDPNFPVSASVTMPEGISLYEALNSEQVDQILDQTLLGKDVYKDSQWQVSGPLRGKIADNYDEYTRPDQASASEIQDQKLTDAIAQLDNLLNAMNQAFPAYGVDPAALEEPGFFDSLGLGSTFLQTSAGPLATLGASPSPGQLFSGLKSLGKGLADVASDVSHGNFKQAGKDLAQTGKNVDSSLGGPLGGFFQQVGDQVSAAKKSVQNTVAKGKSALDKATGKDSGGVSASALASALGKVVSGSSGEAYNSAKAAAGTGGYATGQAYLGAPSGPSQGAGQAGGSGSGPSISVTGAATAFALVSAPGSLQNDSLPPGQALQDGQPTSSWQRSWSWPSPQLGPSHASYRPAPPSPALSRGGGGAVHRGPGPELPE